MGRGPYSHIERWLAAIPKVAGAVSILSALLVLAGYSLKIPILASFFPQHPPMRPLGALNFILAGLSIWLLQTESADSQVSRAQRVAGRLCSAAVLAIGLLSLSEYLYSWDLGIDRLLFRDSLVSIAGLPPGRIPAMATLGFCAVGCGLLALGWRAHRWHYVTESFAFATTLGGLVGILDIIMTPAVAVTDIPVNTSVLFFALGGALLVARPEYQFRRLLVSPSPGGAAFRRLFPAAVLVPVILGGLTWWGERAGLFDTTLGDTLMVVTNIGTLAVLVALTAEMLDRTDRGRIRAEEELRRVGAYNRSLLEASLDPLVTIAPDGTITDVNKATERVTGLARRELIGTDFTGYFTDPEKARTGYQQVFRECLVKDYALEIRHREGHTIPVLYNASVFRDGAGEVVGVFAAARDITERKRAEVALQASKARYKDFISHSTEGVWRVELGKPLPIGLPEEESVEWLLQHGYLAECNLAFARLGGFSTPEKGIGKRLGDLIPASDGGRIETLRSLARSRYQSQSVEFQSPDSAGALKWLLRTDIPIIEDGMLVRMWGITRDLTYVKRAEEALRDSEGRLSLALDTAQMGVWELDLVKGTAVRSLKHDQIFGHQTLLPKWSYEIFIFHVVPEDRAEVKKRFEEAYAGGHLSVECRIIRADDNALRWIAAQGRVYRDDKGNPIRMVGVVTDITERKQAEEAQAHLAAIVESSEDSIIGETCDGLIQTWNKGAERLYGFTASEIIGQSIFLLVPPDRSDELVSFLDRVGRGERVEHYETARLRKDGSLIDVSITISPIRDANGRVIGASSIARDITERKQTREALKAERQRFNDVLDELPAYVVLLTPDYQVPFANRFFRERFGESRDNRSYGFLFGRTEPRETRETYTVLRTHAPHHWEWTGPDSRNYAISDFPFTDTDGSTLILEMGIDITEQKRAEQAIRASEERFRSLIVATAQIVWTTNAQGEVVDDMPMWRGFTGQSYAEIRGSGWLQGLHPDDRERTADVWSIAVKTRSLYLTEYRIRRHDGEYRHMAVRGVPVLEADGSVREWVGTCTDVTERKRAEAELYRLNRALRTLSASDQALVRAQDEVELLQETCRVLVEEGGYRMAWVGFAEQDEAKTVRPVAHAGVEEGYLETLKITWADTERGRGPTGTAIRTGQLSICRNMLEDPEFAAWREEATRRGYASSCVLPIILSGKSIGALSVYSPVPDAFDAAEAQLLVDLTLDIAFGLQALRTRSERRRALETLEKHAVQLGEQARMLDLAPVAVMVRDLESRIVYWNHGAEQIYGWTGEEATGKTTHELLHTRFQEPLSEIEAQIAAGTIWQGELMHRSRTGEPVVVVSRQVLRRDGQGKPVGYLEINLDISERKRAEEDLKKSLAELARSNADLQQFAYVASHDLQEPLRMVASFTQLLAKRYRSKLDAEAHEFIGYAVDGARRMQNLVNDLLAFSRVGTRGKEFTSTNCAEVLEDVLGFLQKAIEETGAVITYDTLPTVPADPSQLSQVFQNLIGNALKFHGAEPPVIHVSAQRDGGKWLFAVRDNGIGIDPEHADRIFEIFQRLHTVTEYPGTGIGLAISKKIVERHGGRIWVESQPGRGATFYFTLPRRRRIEEVRRDGSAPN